MLPHTTHPLAIGSLCLLLFSAWVGQQPARLDAAEFESPREFLLETVAQADQIDDDEIRAAAQWKLIYPLLKVGLPGEAFDQAMKLQDSNPHTCILSLSSVAKDAARRGEEQLAEKALQTAIGVHSRIEQDYSHHIIRLSFDLDRPLDEAVKIAGNLQGQRRSRAFGEIRNSLARRGRVDEAYRIALVYLPDQPAEYHHRQIGYACASVRHYDYDATHNFFDQTISVIEKMQPGKYRDFVVSQLVSNLLYTVNGDSVPEQRIAVAAKWAEEISDSQARGEARQHVLRVKSSEATIAELNEMLEVAELREEQTWLLKILFRKLLEADRFEEADQILSRQLQAIKDQPRPESLSAFGRYNDDDAIRVAMWNHHREMVNALIEKGRLEEAKERIERMKDLPDAPSSFLTGDLSSTRRALLMKIGDYDAAKALHQKSHPEDPDGFDVVMASHFLEQGQVDKAFRYVETKLDKPPEEVFPKATTNYFSVMLHRKFAVALIAKGRVADALRFMNQIPEHERLTHAFEEFGRALVESGRQDKLEMALAQLPHQTARVHTRIGVFAALSTDNR